MREEIKEFTVMRAGFLTSNGNIYTRESLENSVLEFERKYAGKGTQMFGELEPDCGPDIAISNVSHVVENLRMDGEAMKVKVKLLDTPKGRLVRELINDMVFRPRGFGTRNEDGTLTNYKFVTIDAIPKCNDSCTGMPD